VSEKRLLVLARRDHAEAMRVAAGLTIFGHAVSLVFMDRPVEESAENAANAELLELTGIAPQTTVAEMAEDLLPLTPPAPAAAFSIRRCRIEPAKFSLRIEYWSVP
jgi:hypothetical protein